MMNILWNRPCHFWWFYIYMQKHYHFTYLILMMMSLYYWHHNDCYYPSIIFKRTIKFFLLRFPDYYSSLSLLKILSKFKVNYIQLSSIYNRVSSNPISLYLNLNRVRSSTHMAPNFREIRTLTSSSSEISWLKGNQTGKQ